MITSSGKSMTENQNCVVVGYSVLSNLTSFSVFEVFETFFTLRPYRECSRLSQNLVLLTDNCLRSHNPYKYWPPTGPPPQWVAKVPSRGGQPPAQSSLPPLGHRFGHLLCHPFSHLLRICPTQPILFF